MTARRKDQESRRMPPIERRIIPNLIIRLVIKTGNQVIDLQQLFIGARERHPSEHLSF
jgi:hypothetical protein